MADVINVGEAQELTTEERRAWQTSAGLRYPACMTTVARLEAIGQPTARMITLDCRIGDVQYRFLHIYPTGELADVMFDVLHDTAVVHLVTHYSMFVNAIPLAPRAQTNNMQVSQ